MRVRIKSDPYAGFDKDKDLFVRGVWPCKWISYPFAEKRPIVVAYRRCFQVDCESIIRVHVSADERYELFLDGKRIGRGSERGDHNNWYFETYDLHVLAGGHVIVAKVWSLGQIAPFAQMSVRHGFILAVENEFIKTLGTGIAQWQCKEICGCEFEIPQTIHYWAAGANLKIDGNYFSWGFHTGQGENWQEVVVLHEGADANTRNDYPFIHLMKPATLPPMIEKHCGSGVIRFVGSFSSEPVDLIPIKLGNCISAEIAAWKGVLQGSSIAIQANSTRRVILDMTDYFCVYPELTVSGGKDSVITLHWAESLFCDLDKLNRNKGNRDEIDGKFFVGFGDSFKLDGGIGRTYESLWWKAGRYLEIVVRTGNCPVIIENLAFRETRYPLEIASSFETNDTNLASAMSHAWRTLQLCAHETYIDCPYYEQLMYIGDTRIHNLITYTGSSELDLPRKALKLFDLSRHPNGMTQARYPSRRIMYIPTFSLWGLAMVYDYALWRNDPATVKELMPGVRTVIENYLGLINNDYLVETPKGWNFMDWVPAWKWGMPPEAEFGINGTINWQTILVLNLVAQLEDYVQEPELAQRLRRVSIKLAQSASDAFWDSNRNLLADDLIRQHFSEHTQCLAILSGMLSSQKVNNITAALINDTSIVRTTIYFAHYLFETYQLLGLTDAFFNRLSLWYDFEKLGLKTTPEESNMTRSDCHAFSAHIFYHYFASILGIRPTSFGFKDVCIQPQLGPLTHAKGRLVHPNGFIDVQFRWEQARLAGQVTLTHGVSGTIILGGKKRNLSEGETYIF